MPAWPFPTPHAFPLPIRKTLRTTTRNLKRLIDSPCMSAESLVGQPEPQVPPAQAIINVRCSKRMIDEIDEVAARRAITRSEAVRESLRLWLDRFGL